MKKIIFLTLIAFSTINAMDNKSWFYLTAAHDHVKHARNAGNLCCGPQIYIYLRDNIYQAVENMNQVNDDSDEISWLKDELEYLANHFYSFEVGNLQKRLAMVNCQLMEITNDAYSLDNYSRNNG